MREDMTCAAVVLAAGRGERMGGGIPKQYLPLAGKPLLYYALRPFESSRRIANILLVVADEAQKAYCRTQIIEAYRFQKVTDIILGGKERYDSVFQALCRLADGQERSDESGHGRYVLIHDGARPFVTEEIIERCLAAASKTGACAAAMPAKDTIKLADGEGYAELTLPRERTWMIQTPQAFEFSLVFGAYRKLMDSGGRDVRVTDDAMVVETYTDRKVKLVSGSYRNIKITTPEDLDIATAFLEGKYTAVEG